MTNALLVVACIGAGVGIKRVQHAIESVPVVDIGSSLTPHVVEPSATRNVLIIGVDDAAGIDKSDPVRTNRAVGSTLADVIMIMRVDPVDHSVRLISIPRDSRVELPSGKMGRINTAMSGVGGEANLVRTIKRNFGIQIDNFIQLDFLGFRKLVEVLGGVPVYFTTPVRDRNSGLAIAEPGCHMLAPEQALAYARARHFFFYKDGKWRPDNSGDLGRITRQQDFIKRSLRTAAEKGLRNPTTALGLVNAASAAVRMDNTLDVGSIMALVKEFQDFNPDAIISMQVPTKAAPRGGVAYQDVVWSKAEPMLKEFRTPIDEANPDPGSIIVEVADYSASVSKRKTKTSTDDGIAGLAVAAFDKAGFDADTWKSTERLSKTTITYGPDGRGAAVRVAAQLEAMPRFEYDPEILGVQVRLNLGADFAGVREQALSIDELPAELLPPVIDDFDDIDAVDGGSTVQTTTTETTVDESEHQSDPNDTDSSDDVGPPGVVPTDPEASALCR